MKKAVECFQKAAEQGYAKAQVNLGVCYEKGKGVPQSDAGAIQWYRKVADPNNDNSGENGFAIAQFKLGVMYEYGKGVEKSDKEAFEWYSKALSSYLVLHSKETNSSFEILKLIQILSSPTDTHLSEDHVDNSVNK